MADLANLDTAKASEGGATLELRHPVTDEPLCHDDGKPMTIVIAGYDSPRWRKANRAQLDARVAAGRKAKITAEDMERAGVDLLVAATLKWDITLDGKRPECNPANVRDAYNRFIWLREQVDNFAANRGNFIKA